jgi:GNAT superfamily N-acetyltransferase
MLHRAFALLGKMGLNCTCTDQSINVTQARIGKGECYVALCNERIVGTITLYRPDQSSESAWYQRQEVASIHQLSVDRDFQRRGVGTSLLKLAEVWARARGYQEIALDTPHSARHLVEFYIASGYRPVESVRFQAKRYVSVVLSKDVVAPELATYAARPILRLPRRPAVVPKARISETTRNRISHITLATSADCGSRLINAK